jgi:hypothetical protein
MNTPINRRFVRVPIPGFSRNGNPKEHDQNADDDRGRPELDARYLSQTVVKYVPGAQSQIGLFRKSDADADKCESREQLRPPAETDTE